LKIDFKGQNKLSQGTNEPYVDEESVSLKKDTSQPIQSTL
jgi:hypothetical protein